jgi:hypothetical protein
MPYWVPLAASALALAVALSVALVLAFRPSPRHRHTGLTKRVNELELELIECLDRLDKLTVVAKRKYARDVARTKAKPVEESDEDWKKRKQAEFATSRIGAIPNAN